MSVHRPAPSFLVRRDVAVPMRDGVRLATDLYVPDGPGPWPVLLARTPYGKESAFQSQFILNLEPPHAVAAGFAVAIQDTRGRNGSEGSFWPFAAERSDGADTVDWLAAQDFCDGRVAMYGASYVGATQWLAASGRPEALVAIAPQLSMDHYRADWTYQGGALQLGLEVLWVLESLGAADVPRRHADAPEDLARATEVLARLQHDPPATLARRPVLDEDLALIAPYTASWLARPEEDAEWDAVDVSQLMPRLEVPALHVVGWHDIFCEGGLQAYRRAVDPGAPAADRQYLLAGPWSHGNMSDWQGDGWLGYDASAWGIDIQGQQLELFRAVLDGREPDLPKVRYFTGGIDVWRTADRWPLPGVAPQRWHLRQDGVLGEEAGVAGECSFVADPDDPVPTVGGPSFLPGLLMATNSGAKDQAEVEARDDVLVWTSPPLVEDLHVAGTVEAELWGRCDQEDCDWTVRLCDVDADGLSLGVTDGILRARYRDGAASPLVPDEVTRFVVTVGSTSHLFRAGHRVRVQVAGSNFPRFDRNPHRMVPVATSTPEDAVPARQTVVWGPAHPSSLVLPVAPPG
ncbi:CocE/NonD family hydrolase [Actinotalea sp. M2MS4P-6]|uniref:CocE/NonD family hydrolase n=1 Tax=Actinotalea sp. M2MS4P-6 TaxID=2983762 RepID=UPI0021E49444|nr:CocE/NonD family hydrolase [Actinotalea sp. M2MS4P-6]MCV2394489.1 CocE/NonD family hydrolase [Actinotalea sp. M2MS4P-6]